MFNGVTVDIPLVAIDRFIEMERGCHVPTPRPHIVAEELHTIQAEGISLSGQSQAVSAGVLIPSTDSGLELPLTGRPFTGWLTFAILMVAVGGACVLAVERKKTT